MVRRAFQAITRIEAPAPAWQFYLSAHEAWDAMYRDCEQAKTSIELEQYIFGNDAIGHKFMELFIRKAAEGVKVFIICDKFGSIKLIGSPLIRRLRRNGGHFYFYHPITRWNILTPWRWFPRTHVKTLLVDSTVAYVGSACMAKYMEHWRDTQMRITGPVVAYIRKAFDKIERGLLRHKKISFTEAPPKSDAFRYVVNQPKLSKCMVYEELAEAIRHANQYIHIATPFFIPHNRFFALLQQAHQRGVEVTIMVTNHSDIPLADWIFLSYSQRLLDAGVRVFRYGKQNLHCKTAIIDDRWASIGSSNFDVISFFHNREANIITTDPAAIAELRRQFQQDLLHSKALTVLDWHRLSRRKRIAGYMARMLKIFF